MIRLFETWFLSFNLVAKACQSNSFTNFSPEYWNLTSPSVHAWSALTVKLRNLKLVYYVTNLMPRVSFLCLLNKTQEANRHLEKGVVFVERLWCQRLCSVKKSSPYHNCSEYLRSSQRDDFWIGALISFGLFINVRTLKIKYKKM